MNTHTASFLFRCLVLVIVIMCWSCDSGNLKKGNHLHKDIDLANEMLGRDSYDSAAKIFNTFSQESFKKKEYENWIEGAQGYIDCIKLTAGPDSAFTVCNNLYNLSKNYIDTTSLSFASIVYKKGVLLSDLRQLDLAKQTLQSSIKLQFLANDKKDTALALTYNALGTVFLFSGQNDSAFFYYTKSANILEKANKTKSSEYASSIQNIGIYYAGKGNFEKAEEYFLKSLSISISVSNKNSSRLATNYLNMGRFYQIVRNDSKTLEYLKKAEQIYTAQNLNNSANAGFLFLNMGTNYIYSADYEKALSYFKQSLQIISEKASKNLWDLQTIYLNLGFIAEKQQNYLLAKENYLKGLSYGNNWPNSVKILRGLASVSNNLKLSQDANKYYKLAIEKSEENYGLQHAETALSYLKYGDFLSSNKNNAALDYLVKSVNVYKNAFGLKNTDVSTAYFYIGRYYLNKNDYEHALTYLQQSLIASQAKFISKDYNHNPVFLKSELSENTLNPIITKASALYLLYKRNPDRQDLLVAATKTFRYAIDMIEQMRSTYQSEESKLLLSANMRSTITLAIRAQEELYESNKTEENFNSAFEVCEKGKSAILLSYLRDVEAKNDKRIPLKLRKEDDNVKAEIFAYNKLIYEENLKSKVDDNKINLWNKKLFELNRQQEALIQRFEKEYPAYYTLKYDNSVVTPAEVQKNLNTSQALVSFSIADTMMYTFVFTKSDKKLYRKALKPSFFINLETMRQSMQGQQFQNYSKQDYRNFIENSQTIYKDIFGHCETLIKGKDLIIIPDAELNYLSFDVLLTSQADTSTMNFRKLPYLIKTSSISYAPSASTFNNETAAHSSKHNNKILAFAPVYNNKNKLLQAQDEDGQLLRDKLLDLENTSTEANGLKYYKNVKVYAGENATEASFKKQASRYRILHLAMHALVNNENPLYSKLLFFQSDKDTVEDGMLNASELINMQLNAEMAVLSACNTGTGKMQKGEGVMSLARDFFYAGVPSIVMTSWNAREKASEKLMKYFYKYIDQGKSKNEALRLAKIEYLENSERLTAHPHYWASYMLIGNINPLPSFSNRTMYFVQGSIFILTFSAIFIIGFIMIRRNNKQNKSKLN